MSDASFLVYISNILNELMWEIYILHCVFYSMSREDDSLFTTSRQTLQ